MYSLLGLFQKPESGQAVWSRTLLGRVRTGRFITKNTETSRNVTTRITQCKKTTNIALVRLAKN